MMYCITLSGSVFCTTFLMTVSKAQRKGRAGQGEAGRNRLDQGGAGWEVRCSSALTAREVTES